MRQIDDGVYWRRFSSGSDVKIRSRKRRKKMAEIVTLHKIWVKIENYKIKSPKTGIFH